MNSTYILTTKDETHPPINKIEAPNLTEAIILFSKINQFLYKYYYLRNFY